MAPRNQVPAVGIGGPVPNHAISEDDLAAAEQLVGQEAHKDSAGTLICVTQVRLRELQYFCSSPIAIMSYVDDGVTSLAKLLLLGRIKQEGRLFTDPSPTTPTLAVSWISVPHPRQLQDAVEC